MTRNGSIVRFVGYGGQGSVGGGGGSNDSDSRYATTGVGVQQQGQQHQSHQQQDGGNASADPQIIEALKSPKDRIFVLKLGEQMEGLIHERK